MSTLRSCSHEQGAIASSVVRFNEEQMAANTPTKLSKFERHFERNISKTCFREHDASFSIHIQHARLPKNRICNHVDEHSLSMLSVHPTSYNVFVSGIVFRMSSDIASRSEGRFLHAFQLASHWVI